MATHTSVLAWEILWTEEPIGLQYMYYVVTKQLDMTWRLNHSRNDEILFHGGTSARSCTACVWMWRRQKKATMLWYCYLYL